MSSKETRLAKFVAGGWAGWTVVWCPSPGKRVPPCHTRVPLSHSCKSRRTTATLDGRRWLGWSGRRATDSKLPANSSAKVASGRWEASPGNLLTMFLQVTFPIQREKGDGEEQRDISSAPSFLPHRRTDKDGRKEEWNERMNHKVTWNLFGPANGGYQLPIVELTERTEDPKGRFQVGERGIPLWPHDVSRREHLRLALAQRVQDFVICHAHTPIQWQKRTKLDIDQ